MVKKAFYRVNWTKIAGGSKWIYDSETVWAQNQQSFSGMCKSDSFTIGCVILPWAYHYWRNFARVCRVFYFLINKIALKMVFPIAWFSNALKSVTANMGFHNQGQRRGGAWHIWHLGTMEFNYIIDCHTPPPFPLLIETNPSWLQTNWGGRIWCNHYASTFLQT